MESSMKMVCFPEFFVLYTLVLMSEHRVSASNAITGQLDGLFVQHPYHSLTGESISTKRVPSELHCSMNCQRHDKCYSFNFAAASDSLGNFVCELLPRTKSYSQKNFKTNDSFHHFSPKELCSPNVKNFPTYDSDNAYDCLCQDGFTGLRCEIDIDECASSPCLHGRCKNKINAFECTCDPGFKGLRCDTDIDECLSSPCKNGGLCLNQVNAYKCTCAPGFKGTNCETDIDECLSSPCKNGGICMNQVNAYKCNCTAGFTGTNCETDIDECLSSPCKNGGICVNQVNAYKCTCTSGLTGTNCETAIATGACSSNPCKNGGTCTSSANKYTCNCLPDYYGPKCGMNLYVSNVHKKGDDAIADCQQKGMELAKIDRDAINSILKKLMTSDSFIGLRKSAGEWKWIADNSTLSGYSNWASHQPASGADWCVVMDFNNGKWKTDHCTSSRPFACRNHFSN